ARVSPVSPVSPVRPVRRTGARGPTTGGPRSGGSERVDRHRPDAPLVGHDPGAPRVERVLEADLEAVPLDGEHGGALLDDPGEVRRAVAVTGARVGRHQQPGLGPVDAGLPLPLATEPPDVAGPV